MGVVAIIKLEKYMTNTYILNIIISKPNYWYEFCLVIFVKIYKSFDKNLYGAILFFGLTISLKIEDKGKPWLDFQEVVK